MFDNFKWLVKKTWLIFSTLLNASFVIILWYIIWQHGTSPSIIKEVASNKVEVEFKDYVVILLTALSVMIALGGVFAAFLAVFGYVEGKRLIERNVKEEVKNEMGPVVERKLAEWHAMQQSAKDTDAEDREVNALISGLDEDDANGSDNDEKL